MRRAQRAIDLLERRIQIRPVHSKAFVKLHQSGQVSWAAITKAKFVLRLLFSPQGPVFKEHVVEGIRPFIGSVMVVNASSRDEVRSILEGDVFVTQGIWDWEKVKILPFRTTFRHQPGGAGE
ncbi:YCII-related domain protein [Drepanopeziza brunnea f. sp. 'multigermtubi' MB_m1]|uniref:YCII-related domain protein n=1 Tax=Marssonina brunnea f. sp. multigermtubi (strain MB_m1) TaxID=1072389 RepID=K1X1Q5_MARBU|nr:YCII-related domain protein [Drepanopeziza brunnea f. sp. 'multigermtubi' MB_m1]EKD14743.1 YCII-related domain protein [Drepanopeziza brunnea f. sp. 'multigermtubi' MB_m1]